MSAAVPRHLRNPLRAYDEDGREIEPPTIAYLRAQGETTAFVTCLMEGCGRAAVISTDPFPASLPFPDIALHTRCSGCGGKRVAVRKDMIAHYERLRENGIDVFRK